MISVELILWKRSMKRQTAFLKRSWKRPFSSLIVGAMFLRRFGSAGDLWSLAREDIRPLSWSWGQIQFGRLLSVFFSADNGRLRNEGAGKHQRLAAYSANRQNWILNSWSTTTCRCVVQLLNTESRRLLYAWDKPWQIRVLDPSSSGFHTAELIWISWAEFPL